MIRQAPPLAARGFAALGPAALALVFALQGCGGADGPRPNVLLITIDTLRADFVGAYGSQDGATPNIDALARGGVVFETGIAASSATVPAHASIMTGRFAREHSVGLLNGPTRLVGAETFAERFRDAGYDTAAFVGNVVLKRRTGLDAGFAVYDDELPGAELHRRDHFERTAEDTGARALAWLARERAGPFLLWVHLQDPHGPYTPPAPFDALVSSTSLRTERELPVLGLQRARGGIPAYQALDGVRRPREYASRYAGEIAYADRVVGELVDAVRARSGASGAVVLLTSDHGESFGEDGFFFQHGHASTPELARVPLIVAAPGISPARSSVPVGHADVAPTLLELAGLPPLRGISGRSLAPLVRGAGGLDERVLFCETPADVGIYAGDRFVRLSGWSPPKDPAQNGPAGSEIAEVEDELTWTAYTRDDTGDWRRARGEPGEEERKPVLRYLRSEVPVAPAAAMTAEDIERLRALGYLAPE